MSDPRRAKSSAPPSATATARGRPRDPERVERVLAAAGRLFQEQGFDRTTMDDVARQAGVAKMTVYSYFPSKEALFEAAIERGTNRAMHAELPFLDPADPHETLTRFGRGFMALMRHQHVARMQAMLFNMGDSHAALREAFYRQGPDRVVRTLSDYFKLADKAGTLRIPDPEIAAEQFVALFINVGQFRVWLNLTPPTQQEDAALLKANIALFMKGHGP